MRLIPENIGFAPINDVARFCALFVDDEKCSRSVMARRIAPIGEMSLAMPPAKFNGRETLLRFGLSQAT